MRADRNRALERLESVRPPKIFQGAWFVFGLALLVRLLYLIGYRSNPFFADPQMDALYHDRWAMSIAKGDWVGSEVFFRAPLYPYFLGVVYAVFGHSYLIARLIQFAIGAGSCVLVYRIGRRLYGPVVGLVAGVMAALLGTSVYYEGELLLVVLETFLSLLAIELLLMSAERPRRHLLWGTFVAGMALGLAAVTRPNFLVFLPVALLFLLKRLRAFGRAHWALALGLYLAGVAAPIVPVLVRNYVVGEDFVPIASQGGLNFYLGNNPSADGMAALAPEFRPTWYGGIRDATRLAEEALGRPLKPSEVSDYWFARGIKWAGEHPAAWLRLSLKKFLLFWQAFEIPNDEDFYFFSRYSFLFRIPLLLTFGAVAPLAVTGLVLAGACRKGPAVLAACIGLYALSISAFFVCGRFRAPIVPLLCVPAAYFLVEGLALLRRSREWIPVAPALAVLLGAGLLVNLDLFGLGKRHTFAESYLRLGIVEAAAGKTPAAESSYRAAMQADPGFAEAHDNLGVLYMQQARSREALAEFETAYRINPAYARTLNNLAAWYEHENQLPTARKFIDQALAIRGDEVEVRYNAGVIYGRQGDFAGSASHFRRLLDIEPGHQAGRLGLGKSLMMEQKLLDAATAFSQVVEREPKNAEALYYLGLVRAQMHDLAGAKRAWQQCLAVRPDYEAAAKQLESLNALPPSMRRS